jgi:probable HAF family extracellular repeat protein
MHAHQTLFLTRVLPATLAATAVLSLAAAPADAQSFAPEAIGPADWFSAVAVDINDRGDIAGNGTNRNALSRGWFKPANAAFIELPAPIQGAFALNDAGRMIVRGGSASWIYDSGNLTPIPGLDGTTDNVIARSINNAGVVVGDSRQDFPLSNQQAFLWAGGDPIDLGSLGSAGSSATGVNDFGLVVGQARTAAGIPSGFLYDGTSMINLTGTTGGSALGINNAGVVVGRIGLEAFRWRNGTITLLSNLDVPSDSVAFSINEFGVIVGDVGGSAFVYRGGQMVNLNTLLPPGSGWVLRAARAINNFGEIVGTGTFNGRTRAFVLRPSCQADFNQDGTLDFFDYLDFVAHFAAESAFADFNRDGQTDFFDYLDFVQAYAGQCA